MSIHNEDGLFTFCQVLRHELEHEIRPYGKVEGLRSEDIEVTATAFVPNPTYVGRPHPAPNARVIPDILPQITEAAMEMVDALHDTFTGPLEFCVLQKPSVDLGTVVNILRVNSMCIQQHIHYSVNPGGTFYKFFVKCRGTKSATLPVQAYEDEVVELSRFSAAIVKLNQDFKDQSWVQDILYQRQKDNNARMLMTGRTYEVTHIHLTQVREMLGHNTKRLFGYDLIKVSEEKYMENHFKSGERIA